MTRDRMIRVCTRVFIVLIVLTLLPKYSARGEDDWEFDGPLQLQPAGMEMHQMQMLTDQRIEQFIYSQHGTASKFKASLESLLKLRIESIELVAPLSDSQKQKLLLAGRGDMQKLSREVDQIKKKCEILKSDPKGQQKIWSVIEPIRVKIQLEFFGDETLFNKVIKRTLDTEQAAKYEKQMLQRRKFRYRAVVEIVLTMLEEGVPLRDQQRQKFVKILLEDTPPPRRFGQYEQYYVYFQASKVKDKLKPIFDDAQWRAIGNILRQGEGMEAHLKSEGILP